MSTSLLYNGFGIVEYDYIRIDYRQGDIIFTVAKKNFSLRCQKCTILFHVIRGRFRFIQI